MQIIVFLHGRRCLIFSSQGRFCYFKFHLLLGNTFNNFCNVSFQMTYKFSFTAYLLLTCENVSFLIRQCNFTKHQVWWEVMHAFKLRLSAFALPKLSISVKFSSIYRSISTQHLFEKRCILGYDILWRTFKNIAWLSGVCPVVRGFTCPRVHLSFRHRVRAKARVRVWVRVRTRVRIRVRVRVRFSVKFRNLHYYISDKWTLGEVNGGAENAGVENAGVENAGAITYGKPKFEKRLTVFTASNLKSLKYIIISLTSNVVQLHIIIYGISGHPQ